jgi:hypothetical protein
MNIFEKATREKLRFETAKGLLSVESIWSLNLDSLIDLESDLTLVVDSYGKQTRRNRTGRTKDQELNELRLAIVTHAIDTKEAEITAAANEAQNKQHNSKIQDLILQKKQDHLASLSIEQLEALLK